MSQSCSLGILLAIVACSLINGGGSGLVSAQQKYGFTPYSWNDAVTGVPISNGIIGDPMVINATFGNITYIYVFYVDATDNELINFVFSSNLRDWTGPTKIGPQALTKVPSLAAIQDPDDGQIYVMWISATNQYQIEYATSSDGQSFTFFGKTSSSTDASIAGPTLGYYPEQGTTNNTLFHTFTGSDGLLYWALFQNGNWLAPIVLPTQPPAPGGKGAPITTAAHTSFCTVLGLPGPLLMYDGPKFFDWTTYNNAIAEWTIDQATPYGVIQTNYSVGLSQFINSNGQNVVFTFIDGSNLIHYAAVTSFGQFIDYGAIMTLSKKSPTAVSSPSSVNLVFEGNPSLFVFYAFASTGGGSNLIGYVYTSDK